MTSGTIGNSSSFIEGSEIEGSEVRRIMSFSTLTGDKSEKTLEELVVFVFDSEPTQLHTVYPQTKSYLGRLDGHQAPINELSVSADGKQLISKSVLEVLVWNLYEFIWPLSSGNLLRSTFYLF